jgi:hypothetical protein
LKEKPDYILEDRLPAPYKLRLKKGAQVMMLKNDPARRWVNGSIGKIHKLAKDTIIVDIDGEKYKMERETWKEVEYELNKETQEIEERVIAEFRQFPLQLAYAMTIHKSQGKTFEKVTIDIGNGAFAHGQVYVALSRCKTFTGIVLNSPIKDSDIIVDGRVIDYYRTKTIPAPVQFTVRNAKAIQAAIDRAIRNGSRVKIEYRNFNGESSIREISNLSITNDYAGYGYEDQHINAYCHMRKANRTFKINRIDKIEVVG